MTKEQFIPIIKKIEKKRPDHEILSDKKNIFKNGKINKGITNEEIVDTPEFKAWCQEQNIEPTKRVISKYRYQFEEYLTQIEIKKEIEKEKIFIAQLNEKKLQLIKVAEGKNPFLLNIETTVDDSSGKKHWNDKKMEGTHIAHTIFIKGFEVTLEGKKMKKIYEDNKSCCGYIHAHDARKNIEQLSPEAFTNFLYHKTLNLSLNKETFDNEKLGVEHFEEIKEIINKQIELVDKEIEKSKERIAIQESSDNNDRKNPTAESLANLQSKFNKK